MSARVGLAKDRQVRRDEVVDQARALLPRLRERALETEHARRLPTQTVEDLVGSGLLRLAPPERFGGTGDELDLTYDVAIELGRACGATAWCYGLWTVHAWMVGHFSEQAQQEFFATGPDTLCSSSFAATNVQAEPCPGGMRVSGRWEFSSGSDAAAWVMLGVGRRGVLGLVPRDAFSIVDTWYASGLCGSGSNDIVIQDGFIPSHRILDINLSGVEDWTGWELHQRLSYRVPIWVLLGWDLVAPLIGTAQGMVDEFVRRSRAAGSEPSEIVQLRMAEASAEVDAASAVLRSAIGRIFDKAARGEPFSDLERARVQRDRAFVVRLCIEAVNRLFNVSGGHALFLHQPLQRFHRDAQAMSHRASLTLESVAPAYARAALGLSPSTR